MSLEGMDVASAQELHGQLRQCQTRVADLVSQAGNSVWALPWVGVDRDKFVNEWESVTGAAHSVQVQLDALSRELMNAISRQVQASNS